MSAFVPCLPSTGPFQSTNYPHCGLRLTFVTIISAIHIGRIKNESEHLIAKKVIKGGAWDTD
jgi:hypothetical protein